MTAVDVLPPELRLWRERSLAWLQDSDENGDPNWWEGACDSIVETLSGDGALLPLPAGVRLVMWGGYDCGDFHAGHCWLEWDGPGGAWILDPTSEQFGLEPFAVVPPGDARQACYESPAAHAVRSARGLEVKLSR